MGRANKALASRVHAIAGGFLPKAMRARIGDKTVSRAIRCGRPCSGGRDGLSAAGGDEPFSLLVFGGSQGAQFFSEAVPAAIACCRGAERSG